MKFLSTGDPVLYLSNPPGVDPDTRRRFLDDLGALNELKEAEFGDPETSTRIAQYEMAFRMQTSVPELTDLSDEPDSIFDLYGPDARKPGTFARNCLLARRLAERDVRFVQCFHRGWDQHTRLPQGIQRQAKDVDQAQAALVQDLKQRGDARRHAGRLGRRVRAQRLQSGRHHRGGPTDVTIIRGRSRSGWRVGGVKPGISYGETDEFSYNIVKDPVHVHDLHATMLHLLGIDHTKLTFPFQGRNFRLTDVSGRVVQGILA